MQKTLLDTDTRTEITKAKNNSVAASAAVYIGEQGRFTISAITVAEAVSGYQRAGQQIAMQKFLQNIALAEVLEIDRETAELAGRIDGDLQRVGKPIGIEDVLIAATAIRHNLTLTTGNTKHHQRIVDLGYALILDNWKTA